MAYLSKAVVALFGTAIDEISERSIMPSGFGSSTPTATPRKHAWTGVFPAITTQMHRDGSLDIDATARHAEVLIESGIAGLIFLGSLGENQMLSGEEKRLVMAEMVKAVRGRIPVLSGVAETSTGEALRYVNDVQKVGVDGVMLLPAMVYRTPDPHETLAHFRTVAAGTDLPIMIYNNPIAYGNDITPEMFASLAEVDNFVALKESSGNTRRVTDLRNVVGDRYAIFTGVDDLALESAVLGIDGWVAGTGIAFPAHNQRLWDLMQAGRWDEAVAIYRWFTPLLHLDVHVKFVQYIKLCVQECGLGKEWTRAPRLPLSGAEREAVLKVIHEGIATAPPLH
ncbi:MAG: 4-hydroxy-tetrahydrodipicolinate synthase [Planctomycetota bacterium]|jgi:4-hydroxy-tetrahydrodipicolinate synthase